MKVHRMDDLERNRRFTGAVLRDLQALERMLNEGKIESGPRRIGAEQEMFLAGAGWRPAPVAMEVLGHLESGPFTPELARFNLEANLTPRVLEAGALEAMEAELEALVAQARGAAALHGAEIVLCGSLPTLVRSDLTLENMTPKPRYRALNEALHQMRGGDFQLRIEGVDELMLRQDSVMLEACNTSAQVHLQVSPEEFPRFYNAAQLAAAPVLAVSVNSPLLFGRRLWAETRIALFQQSLDTRSPTEALREMPPRVRFGERWVESSILELFTEDLTRFRVLLAGEIPEDPMARLNAGELPALEALQLFNSTIYRWNRPCFGVKDGVAHIRIESRALPSGPSLLDEMANATLWIGLVLGITEKLGDPRTLMAFGDVRANFLAAARGGLSAGLRWVDGSLRSATELLQQEALPLARAGLASAGVSQTEIDRYLGVIESRLRTGRTGSQWAIDSLAEMGDQGGRSERMAALTSAMTARQRTGAPVHTWPLATLDEAGAWTETYVRVEQYMNTRPVTVLEDDPVDLAAFVMDREGIRHLPVEDRSHRLVGILSYRGLLRSLAQRGQLDLGEVISVREVMDRDLVSVTPETSTLDAIELMRSRKVACLPVVQEGRLVGLVSERDFMPIAYDLLEERLRSKG
jgi:CBS domain-containing protein